MKNFINGNIMEAKTYLLSCTWRGGGSGARIRAHAINNETKYILQF